MIEPSRTQLVLIPSYNTGALVLTTVLEALRYWAPVWVVVDGSTDGTDQALLDLAGSEAQLRVLVLPRNQGKGAAVLHGLEAAQAEGFRHALVMDADGQHPAALIPAFMAEAAVHPLAMVLGAPIFAADAPAIRVQGRKLSNWWVNVETFGAGVADSLFGFRVYPVEPLLAVMRGSRWMRRYDFDAEAVVRLAWRGVSPRNLPAPVRYLRPDEGGVSHFRYARDNVLLSWMHFRLVLGTLRRLPGWLRTERAWDLRPSSWSLGGKRRS